MLLFLKKGIIRPFAIIVITIITQLKGKIKEKYTIPAKNIYNGKVECTLPAPH